MNSYNFDQKIFLSNLTNRPGVYQMIDENSNIIYIGKAKNLKKRLSSYFRTSNLSLKTSALMQQVKDIKITATATEADALLLENNLIKQHLPKYNILLRDDKSYPYIKISNHKYPRVLIYRSGHNSKKTANMFGPYPNSSAAKAALELLQKIFRLRTCSDSEFANRSRACLQYQIKRCSAPCVSKITQDEYGQAIDYAKDFLSGKNSKLYDDLQLKMLAASEKQDYEQAAIFRDQLRILHNINEHKHIIGSNSNLNADVIAVANKYSEICIQMFFYRDGKNVGSENYFLQNPKINNFELNQNDSDNLDINAEILETFICQYYFDHISPPLIISKVKSGNISLLETYLNQKQAKKIKINNKPISEQKLWLEMAEKNASLNLGMHVSNKLSMENKFNSLANEFKLEKVPQRLECADISHFMGEYTVASCVVFDKNGALKKDYRRYKISDIVPGDDFAAMKQILLRRFSRLKKENALMPDIFLVDGGLGQLKQAMQVLSDLEINDVQLIGVAKGEGRKRGLETFWFPNEKQARSIPADSAAMHLLLHIRDEAHRFAITANRSGLRKTRKKSILEDIPNIGKKRRIALIRYFGGLKQIENASIEEIAKVDGISKQLAEKIYNEIHNILS